MNLILRFLICAIAPLTFLAPARGDGSLDEALSAAAQDIKKFLDGKGESAISIVPFRGDGDLAKHSSVGPNLVFEITRHLQALKIEIRDKAAFALIGDYGEIEDVNTRKQAVELKIKLKERSTRKETDLEVRFVKNETALGVLLGLTHQIDPLAEPKKRNEVMKDAIDKPKAFLKGTRLNSAENPLFGIEIVVAPPDPAKDGKRTAADYAAKAPGVNQEQGLAYVPIPRDHVYGVRLFNDAPFDVAIDLRIDGLSMFAFSDKALRDPKTDLPKYHHVVIPQGKSFLVRGWFVTTEQSDEFLVTSYAKSAAKLLGSPAGIGAITASFHRTWPENEKAPADEPNFTQDADATGRGASFGEKYEEVKNKVGVVRGCISVRYSK